MAIRYCLQCLYGNNSNFREMVLIIDGDRQMQNEPSLWMTDDDNYQQSHKTWAENAHKEILKNEWSLITGME